MGVGWRDSLQWNRGERMIRRKEKELSGRLQLGETSLGASENNAGLSQNPAKHQGGSHCGQNRGMALMRS